MTSLIRERVGQRSLEDIKEEVKKVRIEQSRHYLKALKRYDKQSERLFEYWKELREEERVTRKKYAGWILTAAGVQSIIAWAVLCFVNIENATFLEVFGLVTLVCSQTFGLVFVVKYFFGQKPEGLREITDFINKTSPNLSLYSVPNDEEQ